jgi:hypothetical protein
MEATLESLEHYREETTTSIQRKKKEKTDYQSLPVHTPFPREETPQ